MRISSIHAIDLLRLSRRQPLLGIQTPDPLQKPLPSQHLVNPGNTPVKIIGHIKKRRIAIRHLNRPRQHLPWHSIQLRALVTRPQYFHRPLCPHRPMPQKPPHNAHIHTRAIAPKPVRRQQIHHNIIVIPRIERNIRHPSRSHNPANHIQRLVPIKRRDLNPHHRLNLCKTPPKIKRQHTSPHSWLQIKPHHRNHIGYGAAVCNHRIDTRIGKSAQTHQPDLIAAIARYFCL